MFIKILVVLVFSFVIPTMADGSKMPWRTYLDFFPELSAIVKCESNYSVNAVGDHGKSYGIFQIHLPAHPKVTKAQAKDPYWSLNWAIDKYYKGEIGIWSCWHIVKAKGMFVDL